MDLQRPPVSRFNAELSCTLCGGYLVNCVTILDCQHHFCRSCLVTHFQTNTHCPICKTEIHCSHPLSCIRLDRHFQELVNKIVPGFANDEDRRESDFYEKSGIVKEKRVTVREARSSVTLRKSMRKLKQKPTAIELPPRTRRPGRRRKVEQQTAVEDTSVEPADEKSIATKKEEANGGEPKGNNGHGHVSIVLEYAGEADADHTSRDYWLAAKFLRCPSNASVKIVKRFLAMKLLDDTSQFDTFELFCATRKASQKRETRQSDSQGKLANAGASNSAVDQRGHSDSSKAFAELVPLGNEMTLSDVRQLLQKMPADVNGRNEDDDCDDPVTLVYKLTPSFESTDL